MADPRVDFPGDATCLDSKIREIVVLLCLDRTSEALACLQYNYETDL